jgi:hypothetical protein
MVTLAPFCELENLCSQNENERSKNRNVKSLPEMTVPQLLGQLEAAQTKKEALHACLNMLSSHGLLSGVGERPGLWEKLEKWRR